MRRRQPVALRQSATGSLKLLRIKSSACTMGDVFTWVFVGGDGKKSKSFLRPGQVLVRPYIRLTSCLAPINILGLLLKLPFHVSLSLSLDDISYKVLSLKVT
jgi:hypothetical protein